MTTSSFESGIFDPMTSGDGQRPAERDRNASRAPGRRQAQGNRDATLNAYFDQDGTVSRERLRSAMRADPRLAVDFERTEAVLSEMNLRERPVAAPDVSQAVLARVDELQPYVSPPIRRQVSSARLAAVGAVLCAITLVVVLNQVSIPSSRGGAADREPRTVEAISASPANTAVASSKSLASPSKRTALRSASLEGADKYQRDNWDVRGDTPTASLTHPVVVRLHGGHDSSDEGFSLALSPKGRGQNEGQPIVLAWKSLFGCPVLVPCEAPTASRIEPPNDAGGTPSPR